MAEYQSGLLEAVERIFSLSKISGSGIVDGENSHWERSIS